MNKATHLNEKGEAAMVDVGEKAITRREATAGGRITMSAEAFALLAGGENLRGKLPKGDVLPVARLAGIAAAKKTSEWIPLCHTLPLDFVRVEFSLEADACAVFCRATAAATAKTGVEMEALIAVQAALATIYDMLKAVDRAMVIGDICLLQKSGGKSGEYKKQ